MPEKESYISHEHTESPPERQETAEEAESSVKPEQEPQSRPEAESSPELEEIRQYIEQETSQASEAERGGENGETRDSQAGAYEWLAATPPEDRPEQAYAYVKNEQVRLIEAVDALLYLQDYVGADRFEALVRERYEELAEHGIVSPVTES